MKVLSEAERTPDAARGLPFRVIEHPKARMVAYQVDGLRFARERGDALVVRYLLEKDDMERLMVDASVEDRACVEDVREWLRSAELYEANHGEGACLVADHPFNVDHLPRLDAIARRQFPDV